MKCSLAPQLEKAQPHTDSQWAAEGTLMHEIAEWGWNCALHRLDAKQQQSKEAALREESSKAGYPTAELFAAAAPWRNAVRTLSGDRTPVSRNSSSSASLPRAMAS